MSIGTAKNLLFTLRWWRWSNRCHFRHCIPRIAGVLVHVLVGLKITGDAFTYHFVDLLDVFLIHLQRPLETQPIVHPSYELA